MTDTTAPHRRIEYMLLADVPPADSNSKAHDQAALGASVQAFGFIEPCVLDERSGQLLGGHGRIDYLAELEAAGGGPPPEGVMVDPDTNLWLVPVVRGVRSRDPDHARAMAIALNRVGERGGWNVEQLGVDLDVLADTEWHDAIGWTSDELDDLIASTGPPPADPWRDRPKRDMPDPGSFTGGQVWQIGDHRLVVGDARSPEVWALLPPPTLIVTDPPYGIAYGGGGLEREAIDGDLSPEVATALLDGVLAVATSRVLDGCACYCFLPADGDCLPPLMAVLASRRLYRWMLVWVKDRATFGRSDFHQQHELISYGWFPGSRQVPVEDRKLTTVWEHPRPRVSEHHPSEKPVGLLLKAVEASSHPGDVVCDPFAGSGSTLVAAAKAGRVGVGIELRPEYAKVAVDRLAEVTGVEPQLVAGSLAPDT